ncbi:MAG TPA: hypothetical protein VLM76_02095 [Patescibacteria group bacterium]|nr:hypothetical protein [Patescibacteria group bacterium]
MDERRKFQVVADEYRSEPDDDPELMVELLAGRTVFLPEYPNSKISTLYSRIRQRHGKILRRRNRAVDGVVGFVVWLEEPKDATDLEEGGDENA